MAKSSLQAPREDGRALVAPPIEQLRALTASNRKRRANADSSWRDLARQAREELLHAASQYTSAYRQVDHPPDAAAPLLMAGHQPALFHPGVWFKNFLLSEEAKRQGATAVNLLIDNDLCGAPAIRVPAGSLEQPHSTAIEFDEPSAEIPYEDRAIVSRKRLKTFPERLRKALPDWFGPTMIDRLWPHVVAAAQRSGNLGAALAEGRHQLECELGLQTLEVPLSQVCEGQAFRRFAARLLLDADRLREIYNEELLAYRQRHGVRSDRHPAPELEKRGSRSEAPFWIWRSGAPRRRRLFVEATGSRLRIGDADGERFSAQTVSEDSVVEAIDAAAGEGYRIRPRALTTTMFARLFLCDLFIHGIGGAKYDRLTDAIARRYFHVEPPAFATATATMRLPVARPDVAPAGLREVKQQLRELQYHPEKHATAGAEGEPAQIDALAERKQSLIANRPETGNRLNWHRSIEQVNADLQPFVQRQRERLQRRGEQLQRRLRARALLGWREYSFCLFPLDQLAPQLLALAAGGPYATEHAGGDEAPHHE